MFFKFHPKKCQSKLMLPKKTNFFFSSDTFFLEKYICIRYQMLHISSDQLDYRIAKSFFSLTFWKYIIISKYYLLQIQNCPFTNRKCQIYCFDLLSTKYKANSLPVLSAIWTFWKTTAAKHIFGDISFFSKKEAWNN